MAPDCFGYTHKKSNRCSALKCTCPGTSCHFYKTREQDKADAEKAQRRLGSVRGMVEEQEYA